VIGHSRASPRGFDLDQCLKPTEVLQITCSERQAAAVVRGRRSASRSIERETVAMRFGCPELTSVLAVVALLGCNPPSQSVSVAPAVPPTTASWDGAYRGTVEITGLGSGIQKQWCETDPQMSVQVAGNKFGYAMAHPNTPGNPTMVYSAAIGPDGSFRSDIGTGVMTGRVSGIHMAGMIDGSACVYSFAMDRV
jgi:hypothetical protein